MRMSELSERTGVPVATLKFYLREGVVHAGTSTSKTQARYDDSHVERVRLIRALTQEAGLDLATAARVMGVLAHPPAEWTDFLGAVQRATLSPDEAPMGKTAATQRADALLARLGWSVDPQTPLLAELAARLEGTERAGVGVSDALLVRYARAARKIATADLDSLPQDRAGAARQVAVGTALFDGVLATLRRLAQQDVSVERFEDGR